MKYTYTCKKVPLNDSIKEYAEKRLEKLERYFHREDATAFVTFTVCGARLMPLSAILSVRS